MNLYKITANVGEDSTYGHLLCVWYVRSSDPTAAQELLIARSKIKIRRITSIKPVEAFIDCGEKEWKS